MSLVSSLWSLRRLGRLAPLRRAVKRAMALRYRHGGTYTIRRGPLSGMLWRHHRAFQFWMPMGVYEKETATWLWDSLEPGATFFDVGANAGYFALLGARRVGPEGLVVAFEPVPDNARAVEAQLQLNGLAHASVVEVALAATIGEASFTVEHNNANSHLAEISIGHAVSRPASMITVRTSTLDAYVEETGLVPSVIKIDVEGAEVGVLEGARAVLRAHAPRLIVSTHGAALKARCQALLEEAGYEVRELAGFGHELIAHKAAAQARQRSAG